MSLAKDFEDYLNDWHTYSEPRDNELDVWLHREYAEVISKGLQVDWNYIYFSPSSASKCARELYVKAKKKKKDKERWKPHQRRQMAQGTALGDWLQREMLLAERHYKKLSGKPPRFVIGLTNGKPAFEQFIFKQHKLTHEGQEFSLLGTSDGIMIDTTTGEKIGLEIKSKQETPGKTSLKSMKEPSDKHVKQVISYSEMYGVDKWLIVYVNAAKKKWFASDDELKKTPDIRAFEVVVDDNMRNSILSYFAKVTKAVKENDPPKLDLEGWRFNGFKRACALDLSSEELGELEDEVHSMEDSYLPAWKKRVVREALDEIKSIRTDELGAERLKVELGGE